MRPDFGFKLVEIVRNVSNDTLLRVFAVQHLDLYAGTLWNRGRYDSAGDEAAYIRNALTEAVLDSESPIGGAAMLALEKMSHFDDFIDVRKLAAQAAAYAGTGSIDLQTRIAAVHLCGTMRIPQASQALDGIINDDRSNTVLKLAARHSLARIAGKP